LEKYFYFEGNVLCSLLTDKRLARQLQLTNILATYWDLSRNWGRGQKCFWLLAYYCSTVGVVNPTSVAV